MCIYICTHVYAHTPETRARKVYNGQKFINEWRLKLPGSVTEQGAELANEMWRQPVLNSQALLIGKVRHVSCHYCSVCPADAVASPAKLRSQLANSLELH